MNGSPSTGVGCVYTDLILLGYDLLFDSLLSLFFSNTSAPGKTHSS